MALSARSRKLKDHFQALFTSHGSPRGLAFALAVGVFVGASPFWGFHTILAVALSVVLGLNKPTVVFGTFVSNPWCAPFLILGSLEAGSWFLYGRPAQISLLEIRQFLQDPNWQEVLRKFLLPYCVGSFMVGLVLAFCAFWIALWIARAYRPEAQ